MENKTVTVIFIGLYDILNECFDNFLHDGFLNLESKFHLVHILNKNSVKYLPTNIDVKVAGEIEKYINNQMNKVSALLWGNQKVKPEVKKVILYHSEPKLKGINYLNDISANSCVVVTRGEQDIEGLFKNSFAYYLVAHAPCDVLVLRPN